MSETRLTKAQLDACKRTAEAIEAERKTLTDEQLAQHPLTRELMKRLDTVNEHTAQLDPRQLDLLGDTT